LIQYGLIILHSVLDAHHRAELCSDVAPKATLAGC
jgi:hypothetical protein